MVETVANEATIKPNYCDAAVIKALLTTGDIVSYPVPTIPVDHLINAYNLGTSKGQGERDTIRLTLAIGARPVIDDQGAFFVAARFELLPVMLLDLIVELTRSVKLPKSLTQTLVAGVSQTGRYSSASIQHTVYKLNVEVDHDSDKN